MVLKKSGGKKTHETWKKKVGKRVLGTYLLVATGLLFGLGVNRLKSPEMKLNFF